MRAPEQAEKHRLQDSKAKLPQDKLSPEGWASKVLHRLADSGVLSQSFMRLSPLDSACSARIPRVLIFLMKYLASFSVPAST